MKYHIPSKDGDKSRIVLFWLLLLGVLIVSGCQAYSSTPITRVALLAPFEGRYRELGYNAYYAARLAMQDFAGSEVELVPVDDGGSSQSAVERAKALRRDPLVKVVIALGRSATDEAVQEALGNLPMMVVGNWGNTPDSSHVFALSSENLFDGTGTTQETDITEAARDDGEITGSDMLALAQFPLLRANLADVTIVSSGRLPDAAFRERYLGSAQFVPEPGLLATLTYDAFGMALQALKTSDTLKSLIQIHYQGINGMIQFENGYWADAPINHYCYEATSPEDSTQQKTVLKPC